MSSTKGDIPSEEWYVWSIRPGKFSLVEKYIREKVPEVKQVLHPTITTEKQKKNGGVKTKQQSLYAGYLFLQYSHDESNPVTWLKLNKYPFITAYVGPCSKQDLASVSNLQGTANPEKLPDRNFRRGDRVSVRGGVFEGYRGQVNKKVTGNFVSVELEQGTGTLCVVFSPDDLDILERGPDKERD